MRTCISVCVPSLGDTDSEQRHVMIWLHAAFYGQERLILGQEQTVADQHAAIAVECGASGGFESKRENLVSFSA